MDAPGWHTARLADVPQGDSWLGPAERRTFAALAREPRRTSWRLGRWTAKSVVGAWLGAAPDQIEVLAAADGAPEAWLGGERTGLSVSISHRADRALAVVIDAPHVAGCDLELIEPRSAAFVREWLAPAEQELVRRTPDSRHALLVNLIWAAKEAAAKVRREGLRLDVRAAVVVPAERDGDPPASWRPLTIAWDSHATTTGWWRSEPEWVMVVAAEPPTDQPQPLLLSSRPAARQWPPAPPPPARPAAGTASS
jgi:4'-phosphopantetheinyl transferase